MTDFGRVQLYASQGNDTAWLTDSPGNDRFQGSSTSGTWISAGFVAASQRFDTIALSDSNGGINDVVVSSLAYELIVGWGWRRR